MWHLSLVLVKLLFEIIPLDSHARSTIPFRHRLMDIYDLFHSTQFNVPIPRIQSKTTYHVFYNFLTPVRFMLDGENINEESTPADMDLEDNDQIDCFLAQVGGGERFF